ncbi:hypothetical protein [Flexithrix dorotheae]|uniref:hypothetical protein n=1 Tax=Flexithrix dorotheae TaxID=70993 RepID=UPI0012F8C4A8|nr:hypothetical protein [Flexithrix dorotheae]
MNKRNYFSLKGLFLLAISLIVITLIIDFIRISNYKIPPRLPEVKLKLEQDAIYYDLVNNVKTIDWSRLDNTLEFIDKQYDTADFRYVNLLRILYEFGDRIPSETRVKIEHTLFGFRYWWDEPGENSMCYWSENHQILFASAEYLTGQLYPDSVFRNSGLTGKQHQEKARTRILDWLEMRWNYGFTEYYSSVYYKEDIGGMINLIDFAQDEEIVEKTRIIMDLLMYDVAAQNTNTMFISASGRAYKHNRQGGKEATFGGITDYYWGSGKEIKPQLMYGMMTTKKYQLPRVIAEIARDTNEVEIRQCNGLDISELKEAGYYGTDNRSMMMQWGMEAFSNPEVVKNSLYFIRENRMFSNDFLKDFTMMDFTLLRWFGLEPLIVKLINPQSNGVAIQKGNVYTYRTKNYSLYSVQNHHPGTYADQQHVAGMNVGNSFSIFHTHPAVEEDHPSKSPSYWVGYGHFPHVAQDKRVSLAIYNLPKEKSLMELDLLHYTHAYFPTELFDSVVVTKNYAMGKKGDTYCAFIGANELHFKDSKTDDLIQQGQQSFWITVAGSAEEDTSFEKFCLKVMENEVGFESKDLQLTYTFEDTNYKLSFGDEFFVNGKKVNTNYIRYDSPYIKAKRKDKTLEFHHNGASLLLNFEEMKREYSAENTNDLIH